MQEVFIRLYEEGLIYRGQYIVNWCPRCGTAVSDLEVVHEDRPGHLWYIRYPFEDGQGHLTVATTRPETMLGDTAVAVNPTDARYQSALGRKIVLPLLGRIIPVVADEFVDPKFGTGAVKVTPAHDPNDYAISQRHNLPRVVVIDEHARMTADAGQAYQGLDRYEAREAVVQDLREQGLLEKIEDYPLSVGTCQRCKTRDRASAFHAVVPENAAPGGACHSRGGRGAGARHSRQLQEDLSRLDVQDLRLVHFAATLVGTPHPRLVLRRLRRSHRGAPDARAVPEVCQAPLCARTRTRSTPGSVPASGPSPRWVGRRRPPTCAGFIPTT